MKIKQFILFFTANPLKVESYGEPNAHLLASLLVEVVENVVQFLNQQSKVTKKSTFDVSFLQKLQWPFDIQNCESAQYFIHLIFKLNFKKVIG